MKILVLSYLFPNKIYPHYGIFVLNRLKAINKYHELKVINPIPWFPGYNKLNRYKNYDKIPYKENIKGIEVYHPRFFIIPQRFKFIDSFTYKNAVMPLVQKINSSFPFDLIDLHWTFPDLPTGYAIKKKYNKKMLVTLRGKEAFHRAEGLGREILIKKNLLKADAVITLSQELKNIATNLGVEEKRCRIIRNGVNLKTFHYVSKEKSRETLNISSKEKIILSVGSLSYGKGFDRIIDTMQSIISDNENCKLYIIGDEGPAGRYKKQLKKLVEEYALQGKVNFVGLVSNADLKYWYNAADIFCLASRSEGTPNVMLEALACGCPTVASDVGSVSEVLTNQYGILVPNTKEGIKDGLHKALKIDWDRKVISSYMENFGWDWCARQVLPIYNSLLLENSK